MREWYWIWSICSAKSFTVAIYLLVDCFLNFKNMTRYFSRINLVKSQVCQQQITWNFQCNFCHPMERNVYTLFGIQFESQMENLLIFFEKKPMHVIHTRDFILYRKKIKSSSSWGVYLRFALKINPLFTTIKRFKLFKL